MKESKKIDTFLKILSQRLQVAKFMFQWKNMTLNSYKGEKTQPVYFS